MTPPPNDAPPRIDLPPPDPYRQSGLSWGGADPPRSSSRSEHHPAQPTDTGWFGEGFKPRTVWLGLGIALSLAFLITIGALGILEAVKPDASNSDELWALFLATFVIDVAALVILPMVLLGGGRCALSRLGLRRPSGRDLSWGILGLIGALVAIWVYIGIVELINIEVLNPVSSIDEDEIFDSVGLVVITGILVVLVAPVAEEIFYRGFLFAGLGKRYGFIIGVLGSAALFSAVHFDVGSLIPFALVGIVFALIYWRSRSLNSTIIAHGLFNAIFYVAIVSDRGVG